MKWKRALGLIFLIAIGIAVILKTGAADAEGMKLSTVEKVQKTAEQEFTEELLVKAEPLNNLQGVETIVDEKDSTKDGYNEVLTDFVQEETSVEKKIICIDPGHQSRGNYDHEPVGPGASETKPKVSSGTKGVRTGVPEYQLNLEVSLKLKSALESKGYEVILTRSINEVDISNKERAEIANANRADVFLRIHADGAGSKKVHGISVLCPSESNEYTKSIFESSSRLAKVLHDAMVESTGAKGRGLIYRKDIAGFNWSEVPVVLIEMGFMTNPEEDERMATVTYQDLLVNGIVSGLKEYFQQEIEDVRMNTNENQN